MEATPMKKPCIHLICNAHLDPVWQWRWEEGCAAALQTFRIAVELLHRHEAFVFNHNESLLYRWVERYDPALFAEIRRLVDAGRWCIAGGFYLQPDANLPGLEAFFRHMEEGRRYFHDRFGVIPRVAYNFDAFGHHAGLPQILRRFGYRMYIHMRPTGEELSLPAELYRWRGVDGTEILCFRIDVGLYHTERDNLEERLEAARNRALSLGRDVPLFWGLGDHGGGATEADLERIRCFADRETRVRVIHSTPDRFYEAVAAAAESAPVKTGDLQRTFTGCYTSLSRLKRRARTSLGGLLQAESLATAAWWLLEEPFPGAALDEAWRDHLFNDFHDILPGSCTEPAEGDALDLYGRVEESARRIRLAAAAAFCRARRGRADLPVVVLNTNPALTRAPVEVEFMSDFRPLPAGPCHVRLFTWEGRELSCQEEEPEALLPFNRWRRKVTFVPDLPGVGAAHFRVELRRGVPAPEPAGAFVPCLSCRVNPDTGLVDRIRTEMGTACLEGPLFAPLSVADPGDAWGTGCRAYRDDPRPFEVEPGSVRVLHEGPVRRIVESVHRLGSNRAVVQVILYAELPLVEVRFRVLWIDPQRRLKLSVPSTFREGALTCEIPGGTIRRSWDGEEHVHGRWFMVSEEEGEGDAALGVVHSGQHGLDAWNGEVRLSVLRSAPYCHYRGFDLTGRERKYMDLGIHTFRLLATAGPPGKVVERLPALADYLDAPPAALAHLPTGPAPGAGEAAEGRNRPLPPLELCALETPGVRLAAVTPAEGRRALRMRLHETTGKGRVARLRIPWHDIYLKIPLSPFQIRSIEVLENGRWREVSPAPVWVD